MQIIHPAALVLLAGVPWIVVRGRRAGVVRTVLVLRVVIWVLLALAAAGLRVRWSEGSATVMFVVDRSDSIGILDLSRAQARASTMTASMRRGDAAGLIVFGADAVIDQRPAERALSSTVASTVAGTGTNIEAAIRLARAALPKTGLRRLVLFSDGRETAGDAVRESTIAGTEGVAVDVVPASKRGIDRMQVARVVAPEDVRVGEPYAIAVEITGPAGQPARIAVYRDAQLMTSLDTTTDTSGAARVTVDDRQRASGAVTYTATAVPEGSADAGAVVVASGIPALLYVASSTPRLDRALAGQFQITVVSPAAVPSSRAALARFDAVVLDDIPAESLTLAQSTALAEHVEQNGGGLLVVGGTQTLGPAGYPDTPIGNALPIDLRRRNGARAPDMALVLVFDKSGSMADAAGGVTKIELARRAVMSVLRVMPPGDPLGVIAFDTAPDTVAPLGTGHDPAAVQDRLRTVEPGGATAIAPAVELARDWLRTARVSRRQILLISDGRSPQPDTARLRSMAKSRGVELSIVAIGADANRTFLRALAADSGGRVYFPDDVQRLPEIVAREAARATGGWLVQETFAPRAVSAHPVLAGMDRQAIPTLDEYVAAAARPTAEVILASHLGDPVFSAWRFGLGRVAVFNAGISPAFRGWAGPLWNQTARWIGRAHDTARLHAMLVADGHAADEGARLIVEATRPDGRFANAMDGRVSVRTPAGDSQSVTLRHTAPGRYEATLPTHESGTYLADVSLESRLPQGDGPSGYRALRGFYWAGASEMRELGVDTDRLAQIARASGGRILTDGDSPFTSARPSAYIDLSRVLATLALFLFFADVVLRRGLNVAFVRELWRTRRRRAETVTP